MTVQDLLLPLAALLVAGLAVVAVAVVRRLVRAPDRIAALWRLAASDGLAVAIVVAAGYAALVSSQNAGNGFSLPIAVLLPTLAVLALRLHPRAALPSLAVVALVAGFNFISNLNVWDAVSRPRTASVPGFGSLPYANAVPRSVSAIREQVPGPETHFVDRDKGWLRADRALVEQLVEWNGPYGELPVTTFASRHRAISSNSAQLASVLRYHVSIPFNQLIAEPHDSVANYVDQLRDPAYGHPSVVITMSTNAGDFAPTVTQPYAEAAARRLGFRIARTMRLPDGRTMRLWRRHGA
jgi:hypothetical protein